MFRSIFKYTPLLKRSFICVLAFFLLFGFFVKPVTVNAYFAYDSAISALWAVFRINQLIPPEHNSDLIALNALYQYICDKAAEGVQKYSSLLKLLSGLSGNSIFKLSADDVSAIKQGIIQDAAIQTALGLSNIYSEDQLTIYSGVQMYVPTEDAMYNRMTITEMQILYQGFVDQQYEAIKDTNSILDKIRIFLGTMDLELKSALNKHFADLSLSLNEKLESLAYRLDHVSTVIINTRTAFETSIQELKESLAYRIDNVHTAVNKTTTAINDFKSALAYRVDNVTTAVNSLKTEIGNQFAGLSKKFDQLLVPFPAIQESLDQIVEKIPTFDQIEVEKPQFTVQVGQQQILVHDYATMSQAFSAKMSWVPQIFDFLAELRSRLNSGTPPKVPIKLSAAEGSINWGEDSYILDMSWYARYKPSVDTILSGIMWLCCGWAIYKRIPDILSGVGLTVENATQDPGHVWSDRAERAASLKYRTDRRNDYYSKRGG